MAESGSGRQMRRTLAELVERIAGTLQSFFEDAMAAGRTIGVQCPNCGGRYPIDVPDWGARGQAVAELLKRG